MLVLGKCTHTYWLRRQGGPPQSIPKLINSRDAEPRVDGEHMAVVDLESNGILSTNKNGVSRGVGLAKIKSC
jgi:hypothetical protein